MSDEQLPASSAGSVRGPVAVVCDDAELAVECARIASALKLELEPALQPATIDAAVAAASRSSTFGVTLSAPPSPPELARLARACFEHDSLCALCVLGERAEVEDRVALARDLGLVAVDEVRPLIAALALASERAASPWGASTRSLTGIDRTRLGVRGSIAGAGKLVRLDDGRLGWSGGSRDVIALGEPPEVGAALRALRDAMSATLPGRALMEDVDANAVRDVLFGPPRALSDPASKAALAPYGLPLPTEELCASPSRAAAEAARIGFPVRIALASPDLRVWDHPDLAVDGIDNAARVRDVFRQIMALAAQRDPAARLLGVTVAATTTATAILAIKASPLSGRADVEEGWVLAEIGFADPHGTASADTTRTLLPASPERLSRAIARLRGSSLILGGPSPHRRAALEPLADALLRLAAFVERHRADILSVELRPLALLVGGGVEVREACVTVGDRFMRSLDARASDTVAAKRPG